MYCDSYKMCPKTEMLEQKHPFKRKFYVPQLKQLMLFIFLLLYSSKCVMCIGVKAPSASAATSLSMASSLFNSMAMHPEDDNSVVNGDDGRLRAPAECKVKNLKQQQRMTMAKLDAHRCLIRDTVVPVPVPDTIIANFVHPSHVVVPRCTGKINDISSPYINYSGININK